MNILGEEFRKIGLNISKGKLEVIGGASSNNRYRRHGTETGRVVQIPDKSGEQKWKT